MLPISLKQKAALGNFFSQRPLAAKKYHEQTDYDLAKQTQENIRKLVHELKVRNYVPAAERNFYPDNSLFNVAEWKLFDTWRTELVPKFTAKHASKRFDFINTLQPVGMRRRLKKMVNNNHTNGSHRQEYSYFVFNIGDNHPVPFFLKYNTETALVRIGQLLQQQSADLTFFHGMWISNHEDAIQHSEELETIEFNGAKLTIKFNAADRSKTYRVVRNDGSVIIRKITVDDEIFYADNSLNVIFDALFFQLIILLRMIGGDFQQYIYTNSENSQILQDTFHLLYQSYIYPELKIARPLPLEQTFVEIKKIPRNYFRKNDQWFTAAKQGDVTLLAQMLKSGFDVNATNENAETALWITIKERKIAAAKFLLEQGANIGGISHSKRTLLEITIEILPELVEQLLKGVPYSKLPGVRILPVVNKKSKLTESTIVVALKYQPGLISKLLEYGAEITPEMPVIIEAYQAQTEATRNTLIPLLIKHGASVKAVNSDGLSPLLFAAKAGATDFARQVLKAGADINQVVETFNEDRGKGAVHFAGLAGHFGFIEWLATQGANFALQTAQGETLYDLIDNLFVNKERYYQEMVIKESCKAMETMASVYNKFNKEMLISHANFLGNSLSKEMDSLFTNYEKIKKFLLNNNLAFRSATKIPVPQYETYYRTCAALITGTINGEPYVILGQKADLNNQPSGYLLGPGGVVEITDIGFEAAIKREIREEAGLIITSEVSIRLLYIFQHVDPQQTSLFETHFFHIDLGDKFSSFHPVARSDMAKIIMVPWNKVELRHFSAEEQGYYYEGLRIDQSNALLVDALFKQQSIPEAKLNQTLDIAITGSKTLSEAVKSGDYATLKILYQRGLSFNRTDCLLVACQENNVQLIDLLIKWGADVNKPFYLVNIKRKTTPLMLAILNGFNELAQILIEKYGTNIDVLVDGDSALITSILSKNKDFTNYLLQQEFLLEQDMGGIALLVAIIYNDMDIVERLLQTKKIDLNVKYGLPFYPGSFYPLWVAIDRVLAGRCSVELVQLLLENEANIYIHQNRQTLFELLDFKKKDIENFKQFQAFADGQSSDQFVNAFMKHNLPDAKALLQVELLLDGVKRKAEDDIAQRMPTVLKTNPF